MLRTKSPPLETTLCLKGLRQEVRRAHIVTFFLTFRQYHLYEAQKWPKWRTFVVKGLKEKDRKKIFQTLTLKSLSFICEQMAASNSIEPRLFLNPIFTTSTTTNSPTSLHIQNFKLKLPRFPTKNPTLVFTLNSSSGSATTNNNNNDNTIINPYPDDPDPVRVSAVSSENRARDGRDRRKIVKVAWEKLVRWSRTWRSKAKTDILERTNKVKKFYIFISCIAMFRLLRLFYIIWESFIQMIHGGW